MSSFPFDTTPTWVKMLRVGALGASVAFHMALIWFGFHHTLRPEKKDNWVQMAMVENKPPPPPPEKVPPKPKPKPVEFKDTVKEPQPPPPEAQPEQRVVRRIMGLSANSFAEGSGTGIDARAGTTLGTHATDETLSLEAARNAVPFALATTQPKLRSKPEFIAPPDLKTPGIVEVLLDLDARGRVIAARLAPGRALLGNGAEEACLREWKKLSFIPAKQGDEAVPVRDVPERCQYVLQTW